MKENNTKSIVSLTLGIVGMVAWLFPIFGFPCSITGIIFGILGVKNGKKAGLILSIIAFVLTLINSALGAYLGYIGAL